MAFPVASHPEPEYRFYTELIKKIYSEDVLDYIREYARTHPNEALTHEEYIGVLLSNTRKTVTLAISEGRTSNNTLPVCTSSVDRHGVPIRPRARKTRHPSLKTLRKIPEHREIRDSCEIKIRPKMPTMDSSFTTESFAELSLGHPKRAKTACTASDFATAVNELNVSKGCDSPAAQSPQPVRRAMTEIVIDLQGLHSNNPHPHSHHLQYPTTTTLDTSSSPLHAAKSDYTPHVHAHARSTRRFNTMNKRDSLMKSARLSMSKVFKWNNVRPRSKHDMREDYHHTSRGVGVGVGTQ